jgi:hypothetical protein
MGMAAQSPAYVEHVLEVVPQRTVINKGRAAQLAHGKYGDAKRAAHIALPQDSNSSSVNVT